MKLSKLLALLLAVLMMVSVLAACQTGTPATEAPTDKATEKPTDSGTEPSDEPEPTEEGVVGSDLPLDPNKCTITHWTGYNGDDRWVMEEVFTDFNKNDEIGQIKLSYMDWGILSQKMATAYASDTGPDTYCSSARTPYYNGCQFDMQPAYDDGRLTMDFYPTALIDDISWDGGVWASPMCVFGVGLYYSVDAYTEMGYTAAPTTVDQLVEYGKALTKVGADGEVERYGLAISYDLFFTTFYWDAGLEVLDIPQNGKAVLNADGAAELLETVAGYVSNDKISPVVLDNQPMMVNGKLAMYTTGPWETSGLTSANYNFDCASLPGTASGHSNNFVPLKWMGTGDERKFDAFVNFSEHWLRKENQLTWCKGSGYPLLRTDMDASELGDTYAAKFTDAKDSRRLKSYSRIPGLANVDGDSGILKAVWDEAIYGQITDYQARLDQAAQEIDDEVAAVGFKYQS